MTALCRPKIFPHSYGRRDLRRLGERFFRPAGTRPGGSGLGWSIVQRTHSTSQSPWTRVLA
ncbi:hypothetical protein WS52_02625 [Burkholderia territorii]|nr:hypothetical protein WS52_02625 [Burkholderia territorii]KUZ59222.1 hypothetical protein WS53_07855 [Burkholderia territorii]